MLCEVLYPRCRWNFAIALESGDQSRLVCLVIDTLHFPGPMSCSILLSPSHLPRRHFLQQNFRDVELRSSLATSNVEDNPGYCLYLLSYVPPEGIISWYAEDIISVEKAEEL